MNPVHRLVSEVRIRLAVHAWCLYTIRGLVVGSTIGCLWIVLTRLYPQLGDAAPGSVALLVIGAVVMSKGPVASLLRPPPTVDLKPLASLRYPPPTVA
ncbi:MAG TPA: hypothetical protein EYN96_13040 [Candidatus Hydrogenedentes bacterium]|nr:hypothetical protein [Candidatus Hydrogenedentota bacterium]